MFNADEWRHARDIVGGGDANSQVYFAIDFHVRQLKMVHLLEYTLSQFQKNKFRIQVILTQQLL